LVEWDGHREYYKRFDYQDIQGFIVRKTLDGKILNSLLAGVCLFSFAFALSSSEPGLKIFLLIVGGVFGLLLLGNSVSGPTCQCQIRTAVQTEQLPSLNRLRRARQVLNRIRPLINGAQGQLVPEEIPAMLQQWLAENQPHATSPASDLAYVMDDPNAPPRIVS
jgi:hypothetical protein